MLMTLYKISFVCHIKVLFFPDNFSLNKLELQKKLKPILCLNSYMYYSNIPIHLHVDNIGKKNLADSTDIYNNFNISTYVNVTFNNKADGK